MPQLLLYHFVLSFFFLLCRDKQAELSKGETGYTATVFTERADLSLFVKVSPGMMSYHWESMEKHYEIHRQCHVTGVRSLYSE